MNKHLGEVISKSLSAFAVRVIGTLSGLLISLVVSRLLGAEGTGTYYLALSIMLVFATLARMGFDNTIVRVVAGYTVNKEWSYVAYVMSYVTRVVIFSSVILSLVLFLSSEWAVVAIFNNESLLVSAQIAVLGVLPVAVMWINAEGMRGVRSIAISQWVKFVQVQLISLILLVPFIYMWGVGGAIASYTVAAILSAFMSAIWWKRKLLQELVSESKVDTEKIRVTLYESSRPLFMVSITGLIMQHSGTLLLGAWGTIESVGIFAIASKVSALLMFPLMAVVSILAPKFSAMYKKGDIAGLERLVKESSGLLTVLVIPVAIIVSLLSDEVLGLFGPEFANGRDVLIILLLGVVVNTMSCGVSNLLMMTGNEKDVRNVSVLVSAMVIAMHAVVIPVYDMEGAAMVIASGILVQNAILIWRVKVRLGFYPIPFPLFGKSIHSS